MKEETTTLCLQKYISHMFISQKGLKLTVNVWERDRDKDWRRTAILTLNLLTMLCFHILGLTSSLTRSTQPEARCGPLPPRPLISHSLELSELPDRGSETDFKTYCTCCGWPHIISQNLRVSGSTFWLSLMHLFPLVYTGASYSRNPWLMALSKVNMQQ